jgi:23S rRNA pseudouridine1911/1915/1917 synthase
MAPHPAKVPRRRKTAGGQAARLSPPRAADERGVRLTHLAEPFDAGRVDRVVRRLTDLSHAIVRGLIDAGGVTVNGDPCGDGARQLAAGDRVDIRYEPGRRYRERAAPRAEHGYTIVYEDPHLLVVDKASGVLTVPTERDERSALVHALGRYLSRSQRITRRVSVVHRLDRDTSGLLVFAKRRQVAEALKSQFRARKPEREYYALVAGVLPQAKGSFSTYLATDPSLNQFSTAHPERGKLAVTHYEVVRTVPGATLVRIHLETGRRNQIRVHFSEIGHPVLGDVRYRPDEARHRAWKVRRLALHAAALGFTHPETELQLRFESPLPADFTDFLSAASQTSPAR